MVSVCGFKLFRHFLKTLFLCVCGLEAFSKAECIFSGFEEVFCLSVNSGSFVLS